MCRLVVRMKRAGRVKIKIDGNSDLAVYLTIDLITVYTQNQMAVPVHDDSHSHITVRMTRRNWDHAGPACYALGRFKARPSGCYRSA